MAEEARVLAILVRRGASQPLGGFPLMTEREADAADSLVSRGFAAKTQPWERYPLYTPTDAGRAALAALDGEVETLGRFAGSTTSRHEKFGLGRIVATRGALDTFTADEIQSAIERHVVGDWGDLDPEDIQTNNASLEDGSRLLSAYVFHGDKLWIITEARDDSGRRSVTTALLPLDY